MFSVDMGDKHILSSDLIGINWDFETVTTSDVNGQFIVEDVLFYRVKAYNYPSLINHPALT